MLAAALGRGREEPADDLAALRFGVREDCPGKLVVDFQTAGKGKGAYLTYRHYLADAVFLAGLEGERAFLEGLMEAIRRPAFPLSLGRRSCPPAQPFPLGIMDCGVEEALMRAKWQVSQHMREKALKSLKAPGHELRIVLDATGFTHDARQDVPISYSQRKRMHGIRMAKECWVPLDSLEGEGRGQSAGS